MTVPREPRDGARTSTAPTPPTGTPHRPGARPVPRPRRARRTSWPASMSGGQQQMLALAMTLLHDPEVLLIDELSLGLAPVVVQELLRVVERLKAEGMTIVIVEQSLNVALSIADRAVFLEKGQVRFEGPAAELAERDDLARGRVPRDGGRLMVAVIATLFTRSSSSTALITGLDLSGCWRWASCSIYRATRVINFAVGNMGLVGAGLFVLLVVKYDVPFWLGAVDRARRRDALRRDHRADRDPPAVQRAAGHRARRHHRRRPALARRSSSRIPTSTTAAPRSRRRSARPGRRRRHPDHRRRSSSILVVVPIVADRARLVPEPHHVRQDASRRRPRTPTWPGCRASAPSVVSLFVWAVAGGLSPRSRYR